MKQKKEETANGRTMKQKKEEAANGYFTLEATLCMPVVLGTVFFVLFAFFYLHDDCIMETETMRILVEVSEMEEEGKSRTDFMKREATVYMGSRYMWFSQNKLTVYSEWGKTGIRTENLFSAGSRKMKKDCEKSITWSNPLYVLRSARNLKKIMN